MTTVKTIVTVERDGVERGKRGDAVGKIGKIGFFSAFGAASLKNGEFLRVFDVLRETFGGVRRLKTVKFAFGADAFSAKRDFSFFIVERRRAI